MKTCVFITGTNAVGKTTLVKELMVRYGGIKESTEALTTCHDDRVCFAGHYGEGKFGGVDGLKNEKGSSCTSRLASVVEEAFTSHDAIVCEGMMMHTFGINLTNAMFKAEKHLVVFLYCPVEEIHRRLLDRAGKGMVTDKVWKKQIACAASARRWASIGVPVLSFDTSVKTTQEIADTVTTKIEQLCG